MQCDTIIGFRRSSYFSAFGRSPCLLLMIVISLSLSQNDCHLTFCHNSLPALLIGLDSGLCSGVSQVFPLPTLSCFNFLLGHINIWSVTPPSDAALAEHYHRTSCPHQHCTYSKDDETNGHKEQVVLVSQSWMALSSQPKAQL